jgi:Pvc16 N-terminal domain
MSALTIATVTAVLRSLLENGLVSRDVTTAIGGDVIVSAVPPDRIVTGAEEKPQLNLFLYQVAASTGLRNASRTTDTVNAPPLALELYYLITAYGAQEYQTDILLGYVLQLFHETNVISTDAIRKAVKAASKVGGGRVVAPGLAALAASDLAERVDSVRVSPQFLDPDGLSRLWSSVQAKYRPSAAYKVSVVSIGVG